MKTIKLMMLILLGGIFYQNTNAQAISTSNEVNKKIWQFSVRGGYDFPTYKEDFKFIDYKGGFMAGASINHYWSWFGLEADFDYIKNDVKTNIGDAYYLTSNPVGGNTSNKYTSVNTQKTSISRTFTGFGPAFRHLSKSEKFQMEFAAMPGLATINGGEILVEGVRASSAKDILTYHSGWDHEKVFAGKLQVRATYFFNKNWGINAGAYYINYFGGAKESQKNGLLVSNNYIPANSTVNFYYIEQNTTSWDGTNNTTIDAFNGDYTIRTNQGDQNQTNNTDLREKIKLSSVGVFAGITYTVAGGKAKKEDNNKKYCLQVTAKDKYTKEVLPNTDVALKNINGEVIKTAKTDAFGVVTFCDITPDNYTINGVLNEIALEESATKKSEFKSNETLRKEIVYADKNFIIKGKAFACNTTTPIAGINVILENNQNAFKKSTITDAQGNFMLQLPQAGNYNLYGKKDSYFSQIEEVTASNYSREKTLFVKLEICAEKIDCGKSIGLKNILFDLDKYFIREDAKPELNKLIRFLNDNTTVRVELSSHTDSRSSAEYNQTLSQNRANASVAYIVSQGISKDRIVAKGYGESKLLNNCADGVSCSEAEHQLNRRTEFKVICPE